MMLYVRDGSEYQPASAEAVFDRARALLAQRLRRGAPVLASPAQTREFLQFHLGPLDHEVFGLIHLDARHRLIELEQLFRGTVDGATIYTREVVRSALTHGSAAVMLFHNHPSGVNQPSHADELITRRVREALALIDVRVLDHLVIGDGAYSFAEAGLL